MPRPSRILPRERPEDVVVTVNGTIGSHMDGDAKVEVIRVLTRL